SRHPIKLADLPDIKLAQVDLRLNRSELGEVVLVSQMGTSFTGKWGAMHMQSVEGRLAVGRSPSAANPNDAASQAALRSQPPFDRVISLRPQSSCPFVKTGASDSEAPLGADAWAGPRHVSSADVWEAVHRETGLP